PGRVPVAGRRGLGGSEAVSYFDARGFEVHGIDNNMRRDFFGPDGDTSWVLDRLRRTTPRFHPYDLDIPNRAPPPSLHRAPHPPPAPAKAPPFDDLEVTAAPPLTLLEAARRSCPESPFVF